MKLYKTISFIISILMVSIGAYGISIKIENGKILEIGSLEIPTQYGMIKGSIKFKLGNLSWKPKEIWLVPENSNPKNFKSLSEYLELPESVFSKTCKTSIYYNESLGYAFKILESQIEENGSFCGLAYPGTYEILVK